MSDLDPRDVHHVRIHPAIGIARVGNSQDEYFIGPEVPGSVPAPVQSRYKDPQGRVKRQAARFRCFGYNEAGDRWVDLGGQPGVTIQWGVHLVNRKACAQRYPSGGFRNGASSDRDPRLTIDPGVRSVDGFSQRGPQAVGQITFANWPSVAVGIGELRTDPAGNLLVLGGSGLAGSPIPGASCDNPFNNDGWWDSTADGPVNAAVRINTAGGSVLLHAERAWVVVAPPKFAPALESPTTLWDRLFEVLGTGDPFPGRPSYSLDVQPILARARPMEGVRRDAAGQHVEWPEPVYGYYLRRKIHSWIQGLDPQGTMPAIINGELTPRQLAILRKWRDGDFVRDWPRAWPQQITPAGLDRAALDGCVGKSFNPGIEGGAFFTDPANWAPDSLRSGFRFASRVQPGEVTSRMALPWQADFSACGGMWWPVPRPDGVIPAGTSTYQDWPRQWAGDMTQMARNWHNLGFVLPDGQGRYREVERRPYQATELPLGDGQWSTPSEEVVVASWQQTKQLTGVDLVCYGRGDLPADAAHSWDFDLTEQDRAVEVTVRTAAPQDLAYELVSPIGPVSVEQPELSGVQYDDQVVLRLTLPVEPLPGRPVTAGRWQLRITSTAPAGQPYQVTVAPESAIDLHSASVRRAADGALLARTGLAGHEVDEVAVVLPDGTRIALQPTDNAGEFVAGAGDLNGTDPVRLQVTGRSALGHPYVRERFLPISQGG